MAVRVLPGSDATLEALATLIRGRLAEASRLAGLGSNAANLPVGVIFFGPKTRGFDGQLDDYQKSLIGTP